MYIKEKQLLFIHIPKTGGQSLTKFFYDQYGLKFKKKGDNPFLFEKNFSRTKPGPEVLVHMKWEEYVRYGYLTQQEFDSYIKISIVRNPYDRFISSFLFNKTRHRCSSPDKLIDNLPTDPMSDLYRHFMPQCDYIFDDSDQLTVDKIFDTKDLHEAQQWLADKFNFTKSEIPHINKRKNKNEISLSCRVLNWIDEFYARDFELLGYSKGYL